MTTGVLVMAYGSPASPAEVEAYYTHIRRGRPPAAEQLTDLRHRYEAIGGLSPLAERTRAQADAIAAVLETTNPGAHVVRQGNKHAAPFIEDGVAELSSAGVDRIVGIVLAPHYSAGSVGQYHQRAADAFGAGGYRPIDSWHLLPAYLHHQASSVTDRLGSLPVTTRVVFTAHSLPERVLEGDPYPDQLAASARRIAELAGLADDSWQLGWQSAGRTPEPWRGPDIAEVIAELAGDPAVDGLLVVPQGFTSDHLEVLFDLDIAASKIAADAGLEFARTDVVNDDPAVMAGLARLVEATATDG